MKLVAGFYKLELAQFIELQSFSQFVADLGKETKNRLTKGRRLVEINNSRHLYTIHTFTWIYSLSHKPLCTANKTRYSSELLAAFLKNTRIS